ncbi:hypothetical protein Tco_0146532 [Tanacetum coccineum]
MLSTLAIASNMDGSSAIATKLGTPLMLDSYTSVMCTESWGRSSYARTMTELRAVDSLVVAIPKIEGGGYTIHTAHIEYEYVLVARSKKMSTTPKKIKVTNASFPTTLNSFEALSKMADVDKERGTRTASAQEASQVEDNGRKDKDTDVNEGFTSGTGVGNSSLYEQWKESYEVDPYVDANFDTLGLTEDQLAFANAFDIYLRGQIRYAFIVVVHKFGLSFL